MSDNTLAKGKTTRRSWIKPEVRQIRASEAEVGTRSNVDGSFSAS